MMKEYVFKDVKISSEKCSEVEKVLVIDYKDQVEEVLVL